MSDLTLIQRSLSCNQPIQNNNIKQNLSLANSTTLKSHRSLKKLGRKKTVSFSTGISIIDVDCWKRYNIDVSESGGCLAWDNKKNQEKREREEAKKKKEKEDGCVGIIF